MVWSLVPKQSDIKEDNAFDGISDEELADIIAYIQRALEEEGDSGPGSATQ
jgi:hypothetical protein